MPVLLPAICPKTATPRAVSTGTFASQGSQFASGVSAIRRTGDLPHTIELAVDYGVIEDADAALLVAAWKAAFGITLEVTLNAEIIAGIAAPLLAMLPADAEWHFASAPAITSIYPGYSRTAATFISDTRLPRG